MTLIRAIGAGLLLAVPFQIRASAELPSEDRRSTDSSLAAGLQACHMNTASEELSAGTLCRRGAVTIPNTTSLSAAARLLRDLNTHYLLVTDDHAGSRHHIVGIVSGHEIATSVVAREGDPCCIRVSDVMVRSTLFIHTQDAAETLPIRMHEARASCAPVLGEHDEIVGVLCLEDLIGRV